MPYQESDAHDVSGFYELLKAAHKYGKEVMIFASGTYKGVMGHVVQVQRGYIVLGDGDSTEIVKLGDIKRVRVIGLSYVPGKFSPSSESSPEVVSPSKLLPGPISLKRLYDAKKRQEEKLKEGEENK